MENTTKHTPTPWTSRYSNINAGDKLIGTLSHGVNAPTATESEANAAFIVLACNVHDDLVAFAHTTFNLILEWRMTGKQPSLREFSDLQDKAMHVVEKSALGKITDNDLAKARGEA